MSVGSVSGATGRLVRAWRGLGRIPDHARETAVAVRPWLRRETWNRENVARLVVSARRRPRRVAALAAAGAGLVLAAYALVPWTPGGGMALATVSSGPFRVSIVEGGTLQALRSVTYASTIQSNQAKIIAMAPEGKLVQKGDLLLLFDAAPFEEEIRRSHALLVQAQADLEKARQDQKLQVIQNQEDMAATRQKVSRSDLELKDVEEGKGKLKEEEAEAAVANAERELQKAKGAFEDLKPLLAEGFITKVELDRAEQQVQHAQEELKLSRRRRDSMLQYGRPLEVSQARADALMMRESLRQLEGANFSRLEQKKAAMSAAESRIQEATSRLALAQQQLARCEVRADVPGIVVYRDVFFGSEQRKPQVGDQVWANQPLLILPDISKMVVETKIRETDVHKVERNQKVSVRVDAYPNLALTGKVTLVGTLAQEERDRRGAKFFTVTVEIGESEPRLRPGMTSRVEIQVEERAQAVFVPLDAVFEKEGESICYVASGRGLRRRTVALGPSNTDFVVIEKGLEPGDRVALRDPEAPASDFGAGGP